VLENKALWCFRILIIAVCASTFSRSYGAQPIITKSSISSLLQQPTVSAIYRDRAGILWIGTQQGLHRFDGASVIVFNSDKSNHYWIPESEIKDITEDIDGNVLVATSGGELLKWNQQSEAFESLAHSGNIGKTGLVRVLVSKRGNIWLLSKDGLFLYDPTFANSAKWAISFGSQNNIGRLHDIAEDESGNIWVGGSLGLAKITPEGKSIESFDLEKIQLSQSSALTALEINIEGNLIVGTDTGQLIVWDVKESKLLSKTRIASDSSVYISDFVSYGDVLIVGTDRGLYASDNNFSLLKDIGDKGEGLSNSDVFKLFRSEKYIWVGTIDGLYILSFTPFELFNSKNSRISNDILAFEEDNDSNIWVGTYSGLYRYNENTNIHSKFELTASTSDNQRVATVAAIGSELWLGFLRGGVQVVNVHNGDSQSYNLTNSYSIKNSNKPATTKILADQSNQNIFIATYDRGLFQITTEGAISLYENQSLPERVITSIFQSTNGLLVVSENRIYRHDPKFNKFEQLIFDFQLGGIEPLIYAIRQTDSNEILIGTKDHGLFIWRRESQDRIESVLQPVYESGLTTATIYGIELDSARNLWCSTQNGIVKLDPKGKLIKRFTTADGLQGNDFALGASFTSREGLIYFGGANGYNRFDPNEVSIDNSPSPMRLSSISLPKEDERNIGDVNQLKSLELTYRDHFITFQFSVLDFIFPERNQYRYKLENFDPEWIENGTRNTATYTNLPAGEYILRVQGANSAGIWNLEGITLPVRVLPPPWLTWWAYTIYGTGLLLLGWSAHRIYHSYAIDRKSAQLAAEMFEAANQADDDMQEQLELQDELIRSSFEHTQATLGIVSDYISLRSGSQPDNQTRDLTDCSVKRIAALSMLEECLYYQAGESVVDLHKYTEGLIPILLRNSSVRPETIITINEVTSELLPAQLATPLSMVFYELLENCVQHAFDLNSPANYIRLRLTHNSMNVPSEGSFELSVSDNGVGLPDSIENLALESSGISVVLSIAQKLGGTLQCPDSSGGATISLAFHYTEASNYPDNQENLA
jgi:ligand-binding sensor domain-containing protein/two-component sensor histidine kinase